MIALDTLAAAFVLGLVGSGHCLAMCGGISGALAFAIPQASPVYRGVVLLSYNLGRALSYSLMGLMAGYLGSWFSQAPAEGGLPVLSAISGLLLVAMGFYLGNWWMILRHLEKAGSHLWRLLQPLGQKFFPVTAWYKAIFLGMIWGWLPCGLVYSALAYATTQSNAVSGAAVMLSFALGTTPAVAGGGIAANSLKRVLHHRSFRRMTGILLIAYGIWLLLALFTADPHQHHHH